MQSGLPFLGGRSFYFMIITLTRKSDDGLQTLGELTGGGFSCKTLELPWRNNEVDRSCIPAGVYECKYTFSPKFQKYTYEITNVPNRPGIRIHGGNYNTDTEGCVLLGESYAYVNSDRELDLINSRKMVDALETLLNKQPFTLQIIAVPVASPPSKDELKKQAIDIINKL